MTKLKSLNCDKTKKKTIKLWQRSKTQIVTKHKNSNSNNFNQNCEEKNAKIQMAEKIILWKNSKLKNSNSNKTLKPKFWLNSKNANCDKTKKSNSDNLTSKEKKFNCLLLRTTWHLTNRRDVLSTVF